MSFPVSFKRFEAIPLSRDPARVLIKWELSPTRVSLTDFEFYIDRGEAPDQIKSFQNLSIDGKPLPNVSTDSQNQFQIAGPIQGIDFFEFVDFTPQLKNLNRLYWYRIRCRRIHTQEEISTRPFSWQGDLDLVGLYIIEEQSYLLEDTTGVPVFVYIRKRGGVECTACFDKIQKKRLSGHCTVCFGTNWIGGFYNPISTYADLSPAPDVTVIREWGETKQNETNALLTNYPILSPGDLIRELRENRFWRVVQVAPTEKRRTPMLQFVRIVEVNPGDVEYKLFYDEELALKKIQEFEEARSRREF